MSDQPCSLTSGHSGPTSVPSTSVLLRLGLHPSPPSFCPATLKKEPPHKGRGPFPPLRPRGQCPGAPADPAPHLPPAPVPTPPPSAHLLQDAGSGGQRSAVLGDTPLGGQRDFPQGEVHDGVHLGGDADHLTRSLSTWSLGGLMGARGRKGTGPGQGRAGWVGLVKPKRTIDHPPYSVGNSSQ